MKTFRATFEPTDRPSFRHPPADLMLFSFANDDETDNEQVFVFPVETDKADAMSFSVAGLMPLDSPRLRLEFQRFPDLRKIDCPFGETDREKLEAGVPGTKRGSQNEWTFGIYTLVHPGVEYQFTALLEDNNRVWAIDPQMNVKEPDVGGGD